MYFVEHQGADLLNEAIALRVSNESGVDANHLQSMLEASKHRQIIMAKTEKDEPLASLSFAKISKYTLRLLTADATYKLRPYEYNEGKILFVVDGFFRKNNFRISINLLMPQLRKYRLIVYVKNGKLKVLYNNNGAIRILKSSASQYETINTPELVATQSI